VGLGALDAGQFFEWGCIKGVFKACGPRKTHENGCGQDSAGRSGEIEPPVEKARPDIFEPGGGDL
jgi:hypothetical protein